MLLFRNKYHCFVISLPRENCPALCNDKRSHFRLTQLSPCRWAVRNSSFFYKFISLMPDDSLERKGSS